jgi:hypothetical protein
MIGFDLTVSDLVQHSPECERERLDAGVEEFDREPAIDGERHGCRAEKTPTLAVKSLSHVRPVDVHHTAQASAARSKGYEVMAISSGMHSLRN